MSYGLDREHGVLYLYPAGALSEAELARVRSTVDGFVAGAGQHLQGIIMVPLGRIDLARLGDMVARLRLSATVLQGLTGVALVSDGNDVGLKHHLQRLAPRARFIHVGGEDLSHARSRVLDALDA